MNISVVLPVRDDPEGLAIALDGLKKQSRVPDEVVVVDAGIDNSPSSVTDIAEVLEQLVPVQLVRIGPAYPGKARNAGLRATHYDHVAFLDAGTRPRSGWLAALEEALRRTPDADVVYGSYVPRIKDDWDWTACATYLAPGSPPNGGRYPTTTSILMTKQACSAVGAQREELRAGEDLLLFDEIGRLGLVATRAPEALVEWELPLGLLGHFRRLRIYSSAVLASSLWTRWHRSVFLMYGAAVAFLITGLTIHWAALLILLLLVGTRIWRNYWIRRRWLPDRFLCVGRVSKVVVLSLLVDVATLAGAADQVLSCMVAGIRARPGRYRVDLPKNDGLKPQ